MIKPPLREPFVPQQSSDSDLNRIQEKVQEISTELSENFQTDLFVLTLPIKPGVAAPREVVNKAIYVGEPIERADGTKIGQEYCHTDKSLFNKPVQIGIGRGLLGSQIEVSTLVHANSTLKIGSQLQVDGLKVVGLADGVGIIR